MGVFVTTARSCCITVHSRRKGRIMLVRLEIKNKMVKEEFKGIVSSVNGFKVQKPEDQESCDILILEIGSDSEKDFQFANKLKASGTTREVFLTSSIAKPELLIKALNMGFKGYFTQPVGKEEVRDALLKIAEHKDEDVRVVEAPVKRGKIIDVFGGKGGVGTTTVAVNLALSLAKLEGTPKVALMDMNVLFGEISLHLNIEPMFDWVEVIKNVSRLDPTYLMSVLSEHSSGVHVLSPPPKLPENYTVKSHDLEILLREMQDIFDFIVIDGGQLLNDSSDAIMKIADKVVLVSVLNLPTIINLKLLLGAFRQRGYPDEKKVEIIANRFLKDSEISLKELEDSVKKKVLCCIPNAYYAFMGSLNEGNPICAQTKVKRKETELYRVFGELALKLAGKSVEKKKGGLFSRK